MHFFQQKVQKEIIITHKHWILYSDPLNIYIRVCMCTYIYTHLCLQIVIIYQQNRTEGLHIHAQRSLF